MKFSTILFISFLILIGINISEANQLILLNKHYIVCGHIYEPYTHNMVEIENIRTGEALSIQIRQYEPDKKEYQIDLANLKLGWFNGDAINITYGNQTIPTIINTDTVYIAIQNDFNRPIRKDPVAVIAGTILVLASGGSYYYVKRRNKTMTGEKETPETEEPQPRSLVDIIFGGTKKAFILISTLGIMAAFATDTDVPSEAWILYGTIIGNYFGVGGVKLGMNRK